MRHFFNENVLLLFLATRAQNAGTPGHLVEVFVWVLYSLNTSIS